MSPQKERYTVVLADDHTLIRRGLKNIIHQQPHLHVIGEAKTGEELLSLLEEQQPNLIVLDISMPEVGGLEAVGIIKKKYPTVKVLMLTMHKKKQYFYHAMAAGADGYLLKNDRDGELLRAIEKIESGKTYVSPLLSDDFTDDVITAYRDQKSSPFQALTKREKQVLTMVVQGQTSRMMANKLCLSPRTIDHHRSNLLKKFNMKNSVDLVNFTIRHGFVDPDME